MPPTVAPSPDALITTWRARCARAVASVARFNSVTIVRAGPAYDPGPIAEGARRALTREGYRVQVGPELDGAATVMGGEDRRIVLQPTRTDDPAVLSAAVIVAPELRIIDEDVPEGWPQSWREGTRWVIAECGGLPQLVMLAVVTAFAEADSDAAAAPSLTAAATEGPAAIVVRQLWLALPEPAQRVFALAAQLPWLSQGLLERVGRPGDPEELWRLIAVGLLEPSPDGPAVARWRPTPWALRVLAGDEGPTPLVARLDVGQLVAYYAEAGDLVGALTTVSAATGTAELRELLRLLRQLPEAEIDRVAIAVGRARLQAQIARLLADGGLGDAESDRWLLERSGQLLAATGDWTLALQRYADSTRGAPPSPFVVAHSAHLRYLLGRLHDTIAWVDEGLPDERDAELEGADRRYAAIAVSWQVSALWALGRLNDAQERLRRAERLAGDDATARSHVLGALALVLDSHSDPAGAHSASEQSIELAHISGEHVQELRGRTNRMSDLLEQGSFLELLTDCEAALDLATATENEAFAAMTWCNRGEALLSLGRLDEAREAIEEALRIWMRAGSGYAAYAQMLLSHVHYLQGRRQLAHDILLEALGRFEAIDQQVGRLQALGWLAEGQLASGNDPGPVLDQLIAADPRSARTLWLQGLTAELHQLPDADGLLARALVAAQQDQQGIRYARILIDRGALRTVADASLVRQGIALLEHAGAQVWAAEGRVRLSRLLPPNEGLRELALARETFQRLAATALDQEAEVIEQELKKACDPAADSPLQVITLGSFEVIRDGTVIRTAEWGSRRARELLRILATRRGQPVSRAELAELLWPDEAPSQRKLSVLISTIRGVVDPDKANPPSWFIDTDPASVWLDLDHIRLDLEDFFAEVGRGRAQLSARRPGRARLHFERAAALYRGDFLADDPYSEWAEQPRQEARVVASTVFRALAEIDQARSHLVPAASWWLRAIAIDRYDEPAHLGLVQTLVRQGRFGEARRSYERYRHVMDELGVPAKPAPAVLRGRLQTAEG